MQCPLPIIVYEQDSFPPHESYRDCLKEECAWWDVARQGCRVVTLDLMIDLLTKVLLDIRDKMPLAGQFTK